MTTATMLATSAAVEGTRRQALLCVAIALLFAVVSLGGCSPGSSVHCPPDIPACGIGAP